MGTTFVVVANDYFKTARRRSQLNSFRVDSVALLDRAFYDAFRGVDLGDSSSPLRTHSILEDQYGYGFSAEVDGAAVGSIPALNVISISDSSAFLAIRDGTRFELTDDYPDGMFGGCVLSVVSGSAQGYSGRIVSTFRSGSTMLVVVPAATTGVNLTTMADGDRIIINGRDFTGTGVGNITSPLPADFFDSSTPVAVLTGNQILQPNLRGGTRAELLAYIPSDTSVNEYYDIPDENNLFLSGQGIPSFHRDQAYMAGRAMTGTSALDTRRVSFRPVFISGDNNSSAQEGGIFGRYDDTGVSTEGINDDEGFDVDTDGEGTNDAVWIDINLPIQTDNQGRQFRPMVAYRIIDMDGRSNLNAHGNYADSELGAPTRRGSSYGVAEVSLSGVFGGANYDNLLNARGGNDGVPGNQLNPIGPNQTVSGYPNSAQGTGLLFASGADLWGIHTVGPNTFFPLDPVGGFSTFGTLTNSASLLTPYGADLGIGGGVGDSPFQASELEPLLRPNDIDSTLLDSRLNSLGAIASNIDAVTTDSAEIAMPPFSIVQILWNATRNDTATYRNLISQAYLSEEMLMGGLYDLNQPTGNGLDEDGNSFVDDPFELGSSDQASFRQDGLAFDFNNAGDGRTGDQLARQRKANQLYVLALLVTGNQPPGFASEFTNNEAEYRTAVAQW